jgi:hypothetical protein
VQVDPSGAAEAVSSEGWARLHAQWLRWLELVVGEEGDFAVGSMRPEAMFGQVSWKLSLRPVGAAPCPASTCGAARWCSVREWAAACDDGGNRRGRGARTLSLSPVALSRRAAEAIVMIARWTTAVLSRCSRGAQHATAFERVQPNGGEGLEEAWWKRHLDWSLSRKEVSFQDDKKNQCILASSRAASDSTLGGGLHGAMGRFRGGVRGSRRRGG